MATMRDALIAALEKRGYVHRPNSRSTRYYAMALPTLASGDCRPLLRKNENGTVPDHLVLIGKHGSLRHTATTIAASVPFSAWVVDKLVAEGRTK